MNFWFQPSTILQMNSYLLTLVLKADQDEKARKEFLEGVKQKITGEAGKINKEDPWGVRELAYPIKKQAKGYFVHFEFETEATFAKGIDKQLKVEEDVLRYLLVRI